MLSGSSRARPGYALIRELLFRDRLEVDLVGTIGESQRAIARSITRSAMFGATTLI
jgi:hypothetical protein